MLMLSCGQPAAARLSAADLASEPFSNSPATVFIAVTLPLLRLLIIRGPSLQPSDGPEKTEMQSKRAYFVPAFVVVPAPEREVPDSLFLAVVSSPLRTPVWCSAAELACKFPADFCVVCCVPVFAEICAVDESPWIGMLTALFRAVSGFALGRCSSRTPWRKLALTSFGLMSSGSE